jgi:hypothetical protein
MGFEDIASERSNHMSPRTKRRRVQYDGEERPTVSAVLSEGQYSSEAVHSDANGIMIHGDDEKHREKGSSWHMHHLCGGILNQCHPIFSSDEK